MIRYIEGNIFNSPAQVIVNTVNTVGVMGKGLALAFKNKYPEMFEVYKKACEKKTLTIGKLMYYRASDYGLLLFPTKENWRYPSKIDYIKKGLQKFVDKYADLNISSIAFPKLGCGNGELDWNEVKLIMEQYLSSLPIDIYVYINNFNYEPEHRNTKDMMKWLKLNARDLSFNGIVDDLILQTQMVPINLEVENEEIEVNYKDGLIFSGSNFEIKISEDEFFQEWDNIRNFGIIEKKDNDLNLLYELLCSLGYLSRIRIQKKNSEEFINGYQVNEGIGRSFSIKGKK